MSSGASAMPSYNAGSTKLLNSWLYLSRKLTCSSHRHVKSVAIGTSEHTSGDSYSNRTSAEHLMSFCFCFFARLHTLRFTVSRLTFFFGSGARLRLYQRRFLRPRRFLKRFSRFNLLPLHHSRYFGEFSKPSHRKTKKASTVLPCSGEYHFIRF